MFRLLDGHDPDSIEIQVDGERLAVPAGISVAAALLYLDKTPTRINLAVTSPRAPFCMMGVCFECLVEIDGVANQRACQVEVQPGLRIRRPLSPADARAEA